MLFSYLSPYNQHLGLIPSFSLPRGITCPGMGDWCKKNCYSRKADLLPALKGEGSSQGGEYTQGCGLTPVRAILLRGLTLIEYIERGY